MVRSFFRSIKNIIRWFPVIWKDRDWDHMFLYKILRLKLSNMENYHRKYGHFIGSEKTADKMKICINLLDRLIKDEYNDMVFKKHDEKWGHAEMSNYLSRLMITRSNINSEKDEEKERKEFLRLCKKECSMRIQDVEYLFKIMSKHIQTWWD